MKISLLKKKEIRGFCSLVKKVIAGTPYYSRSAKKGETRKFTPRFVENSMAESGGLFRPLYISAIEDKKHLGFCVGYIYGGTFWIDWIGVERRSRRKGVASSLYDFLKRELRRRGAHKLWCDTIVTNRESIALFRGLGFRRAALLKNHWYGHDYYIWEKSI